MNLRDDVNHSTAAAPPTGELPPSHMPAKEGLERGLGLKEAVALNMIEIVGIGPFVVSAIVIQKMGGPQCLLAWLAGAFLVRARELRQWPFAPATAAIASEVG